MLKYFLFFLFINKLFGKSDVYFIENITSSNMVKMFKKLNITLKEKVGLKVHTGETGGKYFLRPDFLQEIYDHTNGTFIECNAAYEGARHTTELHKALLNEHGWLKNDRRTVIMDENPLDDFELDITNGEMIHTDIVGGHLKDFNSCIVLSHFKGHPMGGYGGALKQLSIGFASQKGKTWIHTGGQIVDWTQMDKYLANDLNFTAAMGDAASSVVEYFRNKGGIAFINVMSNISLICDCGGYLSPEPKIQDMGILASLDPVALDRACIDMIKQHIDVGTEEWLDQLRNLSGENILYVAERHGIGSQEYNLINISNDNDTEPDNGTDPSGPTGMRTDAGLYLFIGIIVGCILIAGSLAFCFSKKSIGTKEKSISLVERKEE